MPDVPPPPLPTAGGSHRAGPTGSPSVVVAFDFDGTLTHGGSVWPFLHAVCGWSVLCGAAVRVLPRLVLAGLLGGRHADVAKEALFRRTLAGWPVDTVAVRAEAFGTAHFERRQRPDVRARLQEHRAAGHRIAIVSASPELYLRPVAAELGADTLIATHLEVDSRGRLTGRYEGGNCRGPAKLARVRGWAAGAVAATPAPATTGAVAGPAAGDARFGGGTGPRPVLWAYGNSAGDRELLADADVAVNVGRLGRVGKLRAFPSLRHVPAPTAAPADPTPTATTRPAGRP